MLAWNGLDFFIFLIFVINVIFGLSRGAIKEILLIMSVSIALIFTIKFTIPLTTFLNSSPLISKVVLESVAQNFMSAIGQPPLTIAMLNQFSYCIALLICFVGIYSITAAAVNVTGILEVYAFPFAFWDRKLGGAIGFTRGFVFNVILILILEHILINTSILNTSYFVNLFQGAVNKLELLISEQNPEKYRELYLYNLYNENEVYKALINPDSKAEKTVLDAIINSGAQPNSNETN